MSVAPSPVTILASNSVGRSPPITTLSNSVGYMRLLEPLSKGERETVEEEELECGFWLFTKGGGCKDEFIASKNCIQQAQEVGENMVDKCFEVPRTSRSAWTLMLITKSPSSVPSRPWPMQWKRRNQKIRRLTGVNLDPKLTHTADWNEGAAVIMAL